MTTWEERFTLKNNATLEEERDHFKELSVDLCIALLQSYGEASQLVMALATLEPDTFEDILLSGGLNDVLERFKEDTSIKNNIY